ncbi:MAG: ABC transporter ATP-binding protein [Betaproteobacteria bacterium]|nr:ABC transporter ATP-binding protein [Betaproteobacteria bacterium]
MPELMLEVDQLAAGYGRIQILNGVSFAVQAGEVVGILGHNGMGKTTLMKTLVGHIPASAGEIRLSGANIGNEPTHRRARLGLGYVPQGRDIFARLSVLDNLRMGAAALPDRDARLAVEAILEDFPTLRLLRERQGGTLSGGEQQIVAIARALCAKPKLLLLDEPTEGIQPSIIERIAESLERLVSQRSLTLVLVEQNVEFLAQLSRRVLVLQKGAIVNEVDAASLRDDEFVAAITGMSR